MRDSDDEICSTSSNMGETIGETETEKLVRGEKNIVEKTAEEMGKIREIITHAYTSEMEKLLRSEATVEMLASVCVCVCVCVWRGGGGCGEGRFSVCAWLPRVR